MGKSLPGKNKTLMAVQTDCKLRHLMGYSGEKKASGSLQNRHVHTPKFQLNPISNFAVIFPCMCDFT